MHQSRICAIIFLLGCILPGALYPYEQEINALASSLGEDIATAGKKTIAVVDFTDLQELPLMQAPAAPEPRYRLGVLLPSWRVTSFLSLRAASCRETV